MALQTEKGKDDLSNLRMAKAAAFVARIDSSQREGLKTLVSNTRRGSACPPGAWAPFIEHFGTNFDPASNPHDATAVLLAIGVNEGLDEKREREEAVTRTGNKSIWASHAFSLKHEPDFLKLCGDVALGEASLNKSNDVRKLRAAVLQKNDGPLGSKLALKESRFMNYVLSGMDGAIKPFIFCGHDEKGEACAR